MAQGGEHRNRLPLPVDRATHGPRSCRVNRLAKVKASIETGGDEFRPALQHRGYLENDIRVAPRKGGGSMQNSVLLCS
jgi:hypothetical protein